MSNLNNFRTPVMPTFCPGCHNYIVMASLQKTLSDLNISTSDLVVAFDIGCAGNMADFVNCYGAHTLHGRAVPFAMGAKIANQKLHVCVIGGDGGLYGEGLNHVIAAARANININIFVSNNYLYSLTTGQTSPTTPKEAKTKSTPFGNKNVPIDIITLLKSINPEIMVTRVDSTKPIEVAAAMKQSFEHEGFSLIDMTQFCFAFGKQLQ